MLTTLIIALIILIILGALAGGENFGDTIGKGCGCVITIIGGLILLIVAILYFSGTIS